MSTARQKRKPVFDPSALDEDLDDLWPARPAAAAAPQAAPAAEPIAAAPATPPSAERPSKAALPPAAPQRTRDSAAAQARPSQTPATKPANGAPSDQPRHLATVTAAPGSVRKRTRPTSCTTLTGPCSTATSPSARAPTPPASLAGAFMVLPSLRHTCHASWWRRK